MHLYCKTSSPLKTWAQIWFSCSYDLPWHRQVEKSQGQPFSKQVKRVDPTSPQIRVWQKNSDSEEIPKKLAWVPNICKIWCKMERSNSQLRRPPFTDRLSQGKCCTCIVKRPVRIDMRGCFRTLAKIWFSMLIWHSLKQQVEKMYIALVHKILLAKTYILSSEKIKTLVEKRPSIPVCKAY
jgi:hypothetical protein